VQTGKRKKTKIEVYIGVSKETEPERWARWRRMLDEGVYATKAELARGEGVSRAAATMGLKKQFASS